jgi:hypothetical protein|tara:strand:- start:28133 stop:28450 length:318 start_codon:yes stop_codon:yes gene_type:complete
MKPPTLRGRVLLDVLRGVIVLASAVDVYWAIKVQDSLHELNPVGRWLIKIGGGDVALFMACKLLGTVLAIWFIGLLYSKRGKIALLATFGVALFQTVLVWFLFFG